MLESFHQITPDRPHACTFAENIHRDAEEQTRHLDCASSDEYAFAAVRFEPIREEERKYQAMEDIYSFD